MTAELTWKEDRPRGLRAANTPTLGGSITVHSAHKINQRFPLALAG
jgi:hypothetical protein